MRLLNCQSLRQYKTSIFIIVLLLCSCTLGPDFKRPIAPNVQGYTPKPLAKKTSSTKIHGGQTQYFVSDLDIPTQWWELYHSPSLNSLIQQSLKTNPHIKAAQAALLVAKETVYAQQGAYFPAITASFSPSRSKTPNSLAPLAASGDPYLTLY